MYAKSLKCVLCQTEYPLIPMYECEVCGGILSVTFDYPDSFRKHIAKSLSLDYTAQLLPINPKHFISIGQGNTPLQIANRLASRLGIKQLLLKCEFTNPTGSFKDRPVSVGMAKALEFGYKKVIVASSGNGAAAVSALAAKAGLEALIFVPESTPPEKVKQAAFYGARVIKVEGPYSNSFKLAKEICQNEHEFFNLTTTFINPYTVDGDKIVAYELFHQMQGVVPDTIFVPIGAGPLLVGIFKGYQELRDMGVISKLPKMIGVQAEGCSPIARAYKNNETEVQSDDHPKTIAGGICDGLTGYSKDGTYTLSIIRKSKGLALFCNDSAILEAQKWLAVDEGIFVEPSSAAAITAVEKTLQEHTIDTDEVVVTILTGHGLKDMASVKLSMDIQSVANDVNQVINQLM